MAVYKKIRQGTFGVPLRFILDKPGGALWDLTGATVTLIMSGGNTPTRLEKTCTIDTPASGTCHYDLTAADTAIPGKYKLQINMDYGTSKPITVDEGELEILESL